MTKKARRLIPLFFASGFGLVMVGVAGCSGSTDEVAAKRDEAQTQFASDVDSIEGQWETCELQLAQTGTCVVPGNSTTQGVVIVDPTIQSIPNVFDALHAAERKIAQVQQVLAQLKSNMCDVIGPFASLNHPYFFYGGSVQGGAVGFGQAGMDVVFDMTNLQSAVFGYKGGGIGTLVGAEGSAYAGYGFGIKPDVVQAWSGVFCTGSASVGLKIPLPEGLGASIGGSAFVSDDSSVYGGAVALSAGSTNPLPIPLSGGAALSMGNWTEWDAATQTLAQNGFFINQSMQTDPSTGKQYIQYASAKDMALALLFNQPNQLGATAAAQVLALDLQKKTGLTIDQLCPQQAAAAANTPPAPVAAAGTACKKTEQKLETTYNAAKDAIKQAFTGTIPAGGTGPAPGDAGTDAPPAKDSCVGRNDGTYCSQLAVNGAIVCKGGQIAYGEQCPGTQVCAGPNGPGTQIVCQ